MEQENEFLVVIDVQPAYQESIEQILYDIVEEINNTDKPIIFFYVGKQMDCDNKEDVIGFLLENGVDEKKIDGIKFIEKDYGYLRAWMDCGIPHETIIKAVNYMKKNKIYDSRDFSDTDWSFIDNNYLSNEILITEPIFYPDFNTKIFELKELNNLQLIGGGRYECLLEIDLFLKGIDKKTMINERLCYNRDDRKAKMHKKNKIK